MYRNYIATDSETGKQVTSNVLQYNEETDADIRKAFKDWGAKRLPPGLMRIQSMPWESNGRPSLGPILTFFYRGGYRIAIEEFGDHKTICRFKYGYFVFEDGTIDTLMIGGSVVPISTKTYKPEFKVKIMGEIDKAIAIQKERGRELGAIETCISYPNCFWAGDTLFAIINNSERSLAAFSDTALGGKNAN